MSDTSENPAPEAVLEPPESAGLPVPADPIVVIHYRDRFFPTVLILPLLILLIAVTVVAVIRANTPDWPGLAALRARRLPSAPQPASGLTPVNPLATPPATGPAAAAIIVVDRQRPDGNGPLDPRPTASELAVASELGPASAASARLRKPSPPPDQPGNHSSASAKFAAAQNDSPPPARSTNVAIGFDPPGTGKRAPTPDQPAEADRESDTRRAQEEIDRQAAAEHARREQLEAQKPLWLEQNAIQADQNHDDLLAQALANAEADRPRFREDLRKLLADFGNTGGPQIEALCDEYNRDLFDEVEAAGRKALDGRAARLSRNEKVKILRAHGWTEQRILIYLWKLEGLNVLARNGPRDDMEALVWAARQILAVPLTKSVPATVRSLAPPRSAAPHRSASRPTRKTRIP